MTELRAVPATLRTIRANLNLIQQQLADRLGVAFATVNRWESGATRPQKAARTAIAALAAEAGVDITESAPDQTESARRRSRSKARDLCACTTPRSNFSLSFAAISSS